MPQLAASLLWACLSSSFSVSGSQRGPLPSPSSLNRSTWPSRPVRWAVYGAVYAATFGRTTFWIFPRLELAPGMLHRAPQSDHPNLTPPPFPPQTAGGRWSPRVLPAAVQGGRRCGGQLWKEEEEEGCSQHHQQRRRQRRRGRRRRQAFCGRGHRWRRARAAHRHAFTHREVSAARARGSNAQPHKKAVIICSHPTSLSETCNNSVFEDNSLPPTPMTSSPPKNAHEKKNE